MSWYESLPKVELHVHLEGAIPHAALWELIRKYGGDPAVRDLETLRRRFEYRDFSHFIKTWSWKNHFLREYEDFAYIAEVTARDLASQNIRYAEMFFSPSLFVRHGLEVQRLAEAIRAGLDRDKGITVALIADLVRDYGPKAEARTVAKLKEVQRQGVIGIGGSEGEFPPEPFELVYREARKLGFHTNAHAGEAAGAKSIWGAIERLQVERIGHGTRAHEDPSLAEYLGKMHIPLEMCPISNVRTGVVDKLANHPIREYFEQGIPVTVNTDDPKMFGTSLAREYRSLVEECGFSRRDICTLILTAIDSSWLPADRKQSLTRSFRKDPLWAGE
ncbi:MAG: adenosine deaminase [Planctomycetota bacterium]|jgi:adenosine deaminase